MASRTFSRPTGHRRPRPRGGARSRPRTADCPRFPRATPRPAAPRRAPGPSARRTPQPRARLRPLERERGGSSRLAARARRAARPSPRPGTRRRRPGRRPIDEHARRTRARCARNRRSRSEDASAACRSSSTSTIGRRSRGAAQELARRVEQAEARPFGLERWRLGRDRESGVAARARSGRAPWRPASELRAQRGRVGVAHVRCAGTAPRASRRARRRPPSSDRRGRSAPRARRARESAPRRGRLLPIPGSPTSRNRRPCPANASSSPATSSAELARASRRTRCARRLRPSAPAPAKLEACSPGFRIVALQLNAARGPGSRPSCDNQRLTGAAVGVQRLRLAGAAVQRKHQQLRAGARAAGARPQVAAARRRARRIGRRPDRPPRGPPARPAAAPPAARFLGCCERLPLELAKRWARATWPARPAARPPLARAARRAAPPVRRRRAARSARRRAHPGEHVADSHPPW